MASLSSKAIKTRIRSLQSTRQITKAMEMVAASKLHRARSQALSSRPYLEALYETINQIVQANQDLFSAYLTARPVNKTLWIVIAGDRGLAGGYNNNVLKQAWAEMEGEDTSVLPIGKKAADFFRSRKCPILTDRYAEAGDVSASDCFSIAGILCSGYLAGQFDQIRIVYTNFVSVLSQMPDFLQMLPLPRQQTQPRKSGPDILFEPDSVSVFDAIIPEYVGGMLYGALCESRASEHAARRTAMDAATRNADEMIADLRLQYNRARQAAITQQITEIVAGS